MRWWIMGILSFMVSASSAQIASLSQTEQERQEYRSVKGLEGRLNGISVNLISPVTGDFGLQYQRVVLKNGAVVGELYRVQQSYDLPNSGFQDIDGSATYEGWRARFGYRNASTGSTGMPLPFGYYFGYSFDVLLGKHTQTVSDLFTGVETNAVFNYRGYGLSISYGKGSALARNFVLDTGLDFNFRWGSYGLDEASPNAGTPQVRRRGTLLRGDWYGTDFIQFNDSEANFFGTGPGGETYRHNTMHLFFYLKLTYFL